MLQLLIVAWLLILRTETVVSHQESGEWNCESDSEIQVMADFRPGTITLDGHSDDWKDIDGSELPLRPALEPDADHEYSAGKMTVKIRCAMIYLALHDGRDIFFMLQIDGNYAYSNGENKKCPSVALMFQIGDQATYHNMGGCKEGRDSCASKACKSFEVDIMHFSIGNAIPGRLYGGNPLDTAEGNGGDRFGHLNDLYAWNPHCRYLDGVGPSGNDSSAQNDWHGAWWHSSFTTQSGYIREDSPLHERWPEGNLLF